jgi:hypothetical protein
LRLTMTIVMDDFATTNYATNSHFITHFQIGNNPLLDFKTYS